jgi:hypothetical protein
MFNYIKKPKTLEELSDLLDTLSFVEYSKSSGTFEPIPKA